MAPAAGRGRAAIADRFGHFAIDQGGRGWVVCLLRPEEQEFRAVEPKQALVWCLVWLMLDELRGVNLAGA